jgi:hypothetical protein
MRSTISRRSQCLLIGGWLLLAAPFLNLGYGSDVDAWLVGERALQIWSTGVYARSRSTGFPLYELAVTPLITVGGWLASNAFSLAAGLVLFLLLFRLATRGALRHPALAIAAFMFLPVVFKNATSTMDYVTGLAFLVASYVAWQSDRPFWCAILIGIATGVRPSNILFVVPAAAGILVKSSRLRTPVLMIILSVFVGTLAFSPSLVLGSFGIARVTPTLAAAKNAFRLFGIVQTPLIAAVILSVLWTARRAVAHRDDRHFVTFHAVNMAVWIGAFMLLPDEPEYLLPMVISVILVIDRYASRKSMITAVVIMLSYHIVTIEIAGTRGGLRRAAMVVRPGWTIRDANDRRFKVWLREATNGWHGTAPTLFMDQILPPVVGRDGWQFVPELNVYRRTSGLLAVSQRITDATLLQTIRNRGYRIVVWREREWEYEQPDARAGRGLVEFVDDPGVLLGLPLRGHPFD